MRFFTLRLTAGAVLLASHVAHAQEVVTTCGTTVTNGVLAADLDCSGSVNGVTVADGGTIDLAGYTLTPGSDAGIACEGDCTVEGSGGRITGGVWCGVKGVGKRTAVVTVRNTEISGNGLDGIWANGAVVEGSQIVGNQRSGVIAWFKDIVVRASSIEGSPLALSSVRRVTVVDSTVSGNAWGILGSKVATITGSTVENNADFGVMSRKVRATTSSIQNNAFDCASAGECFDLGSYRRPHLDEAVACGTSAQIDKDTHQATGEDWDVCLGD